MSGLFERIFDHHLAVRHLFEVSLGLRSRVLGDLQIIGQVKRAYQLSADNGFAGPFLHRVMHAVFFANKKVVQETAFRDGAASVSYATEELIENVTAGLENTKVLVAGLGEIGSDLVRNLSKKEKYEILISNRTEKTSLDLALECGCSAIPFGNLYQSLEDIDVLISTIQKDSFHFEVNHFDQKEHFKYKYLIDLAIPRSISPDVEQLPSVLLYNIDQIESKTKEVIDKRSSAILDVERIVDEAVADFEVWSKEMLVSPTIRKFKSALESIRKEELKRYLKGVDDVQVELLDKVTKGMIQKIIKLPVLQLKAACRRDEAETLIDVLNDLFDLDKVTENKK